MTSTLLMSSYSIFNSCYLNNKVTCEKFDVLLYATFGRPLDVQISPLSTRLQWTEKGRPMDVQYGTWTDGPNKDVLWTSFGRAMPIGKCCKIFTVSDDFWTLIINSIHLFIRKSYFLKIHEKILIELTFLSNFPGNY